MDSQALNELAKEYGFEGVGITTTDTIPFVPEFRENCEENLCGNYGRNYSCPPYCGTVEEMMAKVRSYRHAIVLKTAFEVDNALDGEAMKPLKKDHSQRSRLFFKQVKETYGITEDHMILAGPCGLCEKCRMPEDKPCPFEAERASCLSAYSINITTLAEELGMPISWDLDQVSFFSLYLWEKVK